MPFFSKVFRKDKDKLATPKKPKSKKHIEPDSPAPVVPPKPRWADAWSRKDVEPEEVQELLRGCTVELKSRGLDIPFLLLPFRPTSDPSAARTFIRNFFDPAKGTQLTGERLSQELILTDSMVLVSVMKWCWSRLAGGVVTWEAYELFRIGEQDSDMARDAFATFIPISVESDARTKIIFDFFDLMSAIAAHGKTNGMSGRKLSRLAGWWAFEHLDSGNGFDGGYKSWTSAADATSHLFFAYLRSLSPDSVRGTNGISALPISLQNLVRATEYPPAQPPLNATSKVVMIVDSVSPTPFALLRRAKHFEYRDDDEALQQFSNYQDPVQALTDECRRVLNSISSINQSTVSNSKASTSRPDASWSRFEDIGFGGFGDYSDNENEVDRSALGRKRKTPQGMRSAPHSRTHDHGRPTTPSWADFLSSGFADEASSPGPAPLLLPLDKQLPPIIDPKRGYSSQSHRRTENTDLEPGELASINAIYIEDAFWWVWISSLAGEEPTDRKGVFGRCALIETSIRGSSWLVIEEMVKGAAPEPEVGAYIAEKKSRFGFSKKSRLQRSITKRGPPAPDVEPYPRNTQISPLSKSSIGPDQHARIQAAAAALQQKQKQQDDENPQYSPRARNRDAMSTKTNSVFTLQPVIMSEAAPAMQWANKYDKNAIRAAYLGNNSAGKGSTTDLGPNVMDAAANGSVTPAPKEMPRSGSYNFPKQDGTPQDKPKDTQERDLPALPPETPKEQSHLLSSGQQTVEPPPLPENKAPSLPSATYMHPSDQAVNEASEVPLPAAFTNYPPPVEKSLSRDDELTKTPTRDSETNGLTPTSSPQSKRTNKLKKNNNRGSFRGFFGKKSLPATPPKHVDNQAVAAARAAYPGPQMKPNYTTSQTTLGRRFSRSKRSLAASPVPISPLPSAPEEQKEVHPEPSEMQYDPPQDYGESQASLNYFNTNEQLHASQEFGNFDQGDHGVEHHSGHKLSRGNHSVEYQPVHQFNQGPMTDEPAFVPEDSPQRSATPARQESEISSLSEDERARSPPGTDRWAQIRKNAAERATTRPSEEQSRPSQAKETDDGESDNAEEETIESRVARIKARVAELTGQSMVSPPSGPRPA